MKRHRKILVPLISVVMAALAVLTLGGCVRENPLDPQKTDKTNETSLQSDIGSIHLLKVDAKQGALLKTSTNAFEDEKLIYAARGGAIRTGTQDFGYSKINFKANDLSEDISIKFNWRQIKTEAQSFDFEFGPHGLTFNKPVELEVSYKMADLEDVNEDKLGLFYYNDKKEMWEFIGGDIDKKSKTLRVLLQHFSRYAVAWTN